MTKEGKDAVSRLKQVPSKQSQKTLETPRDAIPYDSYMLNAVGRRFLQRALQLSLSMQRITGMLSLNFMQLLTMTAALTCVQYTWNRL